MHLSILHRRFNDPWLACTCCSNPWFLRNKATLFSYLNFNPESRNVQLQPGLLIQLNSVHKWNIQLATLLLNTWLSTDAVSRRTALTSLFTNAVSRQAKQEPRYFGMLILGLALVPDLHQVTYKWELVAVILTASASPTGRRKASAYALIMP